MIMYDYVYICSTTFVHKRVRDYHIYGLNEQNNYVGEK